MNKKLRNIDAWLKKNELSLNRSKSCYVLINKQQNISCECDLQLYLNPFLLKREQTIKYLGIYIDDNLKWSTHIQHLSFQLARYAGMFYRIRNFLPIDLLITGR